MQSYPPRALDRRLQKDWARDAREGPRVLMSLKEILAEQEADTVHGLPVQPPVKFNNMVVISLSMKLKEEHCSIGFPRPLTNQNKNPFSYGSMELCHSLEGNAGALTNFEVLDFLRAKGASKDPTKVIAKVAQSEYKVYDYLVDTAASTTKKLVFYNAHSKALHAAPQLLSSNSHINNLPLLLTFTFVSPSSPRHSSPSSSLSPKLPSSFASASAAPFPFLSFPFKRMFLHVGLSQQVAIVKHKGYVSGSLSDEGKNQPKDNGEKKVIDDDVDVDRNKDELGKTIGREQEEPPKSQIGRENGSRFSNWPNEREVLSAAKVAKKMKLKFTKEWIAYLRLPLPIDVYKEILKPAFTIIADHEMKCLLLLIRGTHSIKDTLTAIIGNVRGTISSYYLALKAEVTIMKLNEERRRNTQEKDLLLRQEELDNLLFRIVLDDCMTGGKEARKQNRTLTKFFPNKITIHMPQDEALLESWKQQLDREVETQN
ncbi:hypothetical protein HKD37_18G051150 [Glycine soja]